MIDGVLGLQGYAGDVVVKHVDINGYSIIELDVEASADIDLGVYADN